MVMSEGKRVALFFLYILYLEKEGGGEGGGKGESKSDERNMSFCNTYVHTSNYVYSGTSL